MVLLSGFVRWPESLTFGFSCDVAGNGLACGKVGENVGEGNHAKFDNGERSFSTSVQITVLERRIHLSQSVSIKASCIFTGRNKRMETNTTSL